MFYRYNNLALLHGMSWGQMKRQPRERLRIVEIIKHQFAASATTWTTLFSSQSVQIAERSRLIFFSCRKLNYAWANKLFFGCCVFAYERKALSSSQVKYVTLISVNNWIWWFCLEVHQRDSQNKRNISANSQKYRRPNLQINDIQANTYYSKLRLCIGKYLGLNSLYR